MPTTLNQWTGHLPSLLPEKLVEVIEHFGAALDPPRIPARGGADAVDERPDAGDLGATELVVLEVDVVDDLADRAQRGVLEAGALNQHLESALVTFMSELRLEHVEAQLAFLRSIAFARYELEARLRIDEAANQPGAGDPISVDTLAGYPGSVAKRFLETGLRLCFACHWFVLVQLSFKPFEQSFCHFAPDGAEEIDGGNLGKPLAQS